SIHGESALRGPFWAWEPKSCRKQHRRRARRSAPQHPRSTPTTMMTKMTLFICVQRFRHKSRCCRQRLSIRQGPMRLERLPPALMMVLMSQRPFHFLLLTKL
ncbi:hypothetical protein GGF37_007590, partial [Kickxella alabastrina]